MKDRGYFQVTVKLGGEVIHFSSHKTRLEAERAFKKYTGIAYREFKKQSARAARWTGSEIVKVTKKAGREIRKRV